MERPDRIRPRLFPLLVLAVFLWGLLGFVYSTPKSPLLFTTCVIGTVLTPFLFWRGLNFARHVLLIVAVVDILLFVLQLPRFPDFARLGQLALIIRLSLAIFFLWWLNTAQARGYFRPTARARPHETI